MWLLAEDHPGPRAADLVAPFRAALTDETRDAILSIKEATAEQDRSTQGIWIYLAVIDHGIRSYRDFAEWLSTQPRDEFTHWRPSL